VSSCFVGCQRISDPALPQIISLKPESNKEAMGKKEESDDRWKLAKKLGERILLPQNE